MIGTLARDAGVHVETIRYYERRGLLKQPKPARGYRVYNDEALRVLRFVKRAQELGFTLDEVRELVSLRASKNPRSCSRVRVSAEAKLVDVETKIRDLEAIRRTLRELATACPGEGPAEACPILGALDSQPLLEGDSSHA